MSTAALLCKSVGLMLYNVGLPLTLAVLVVPGSAMRLLFADTPPSSSASAAMAAAQQQDQLYAQHHLSSSRSSMYGSPYNSPVRLAGSRRQIIFATDGGIATLREAA